MTQASNLAVVRRGLAEVWETQGRRFVTFEPADEAGPRADRWIQFLDGELNLRWPRQDDPRRALARLGVELPPGAAVAWHVAGSNAVIATGDAPLEDVARFVVCLFDAVLARHPGERLAARVDDHG